METAVSRKVDWQSPRFILRILGMILLFAVICISILRDRIVNQPQWSVNVVGRGTVEYQPDTATVNLGVQVERVAKADDALKQLNTRVEQVIKVIEEAGVKPEDIQTLTYNLYPQYDYINERSILAGYTATQQLNVTIHNLPRNEEMLTNVIAKGTEEGVNQVNGIYFSVENEDQLRDQARVTAIQDAKSKAQSIASAAGVKLKKVVGWWDNVVYGEGPAIYADGKGGYGGGGGPVVPAGTSEITVEVNLNYLIK